MHMDRIRKRRDTGRVGLMLADSRFASTILFEHTKLNILRDRHEAAMEQ